MMTITSDCTSVRIKIHHSPSPFWWLGSTPKTKEKEWRRIANLMFPDREKDSQKRYYARNRERVIAGVKRYYEEHKIARLLYILEWQKRNPERFKSYLQKTQYAKYGLMPEEALIILTNPCAICGTTKMRRVIDHNHRTNKVRGALCDRCNGFVGWIEKYRHLLDDVFRYLSERSNT